MMRAKYYLLDVFTKERFSGNPLAVFPQANAIPEDLLPLIAKELNLSESVFLYPNRYERSKIDMRIFTPGRELPTAGHPTIGSAFLVARELDFKPGSNFSIIFNQKIGPVTVEIETGGTTIERATMNQQIPSFGIDLTENKSTIASLLGLNESELMDDLPPQVVSGGVPFLYVPLKSKATISNIQINQMLLKDCEAKHSFVGVFVFAIAAEDDNFLVRARMFAPTLGIVEDPATGSACGPLGCYLLVHQKIKSGQTIKVLQGVEMGRKSQIFVTILTHKSGKITKVLVGGEALLVGQGEIYL